MKRSIIFIHILILTITAAMAQTVIITDDPDYTTGEASAVLDIKSDSGGLLPPRMTMAARDAIQEPATGLLVYQIDGEAGLYYNAGTPADPNWLVLTSVGEATGDPVATGSVWDVDGNHYPTVRIGQTWWMAENLRVTHYQDGQPVPGGASAAGWIATETGSRAVYDHIRSNAAMFGMLYNGYVLNNPAGICPAGWEVPGTTHWQDLADYLGGNALAGSAMKALLHWDNLPAPVDNSSGFSALPGGQRSGLSGAFEGLRRVTGWWSYDGVHEPQPVAAMLDDQDNNLLLSPLDANYGLSLRCVKNGQ